MSNPKFLAVLALCALTFSCKEKEPQDNEGTKVEDQVEATTKIEEQLIIELSMVVPKDDKFQILYRDLEGTFTPDRQIQKRVEGSNQVQKIQYVLDKYEYPSHLRLYFGMNPEQENLQFRGLILKYNDHIHEFTNDELNRYFVPSKGLGIDFENGKLEAEAVEGIYTPYLDSYNLSYFVNKLILN